MSRPYLVRVATAPAPRVHGHFLAAEVGELAGVSGTTIGQWARWGYIRSSGSDAEPRVYSVEDVAEAAIVGELLRRGVAHADVRRAIARLRRGVRPVAAQRGAARHGRASAAARASCCASATASTPCPRAAGS